jgi:hypothetical protein
METVSNGGVGAVLPVTAEAATPVDPMVAKLQGLGVTEEVIGKIKADLGATSVDDLVGLTEADLVGVGMKVLQARKVAAALKSDARVAAAETAAVNAVGAATLASILPAVPNDASWLVALKAGGVLKVDQSTVISAIRAALAHKAGLFTIPDGLVVMMERFSDENQEAVSADFFKIRKQLTRRNYAEVFEAIEGLDGSYVTEPRKKQLFTRIDENMWPAIIAFYAQLKSWQDAWMQGAANPAIMMSAMLAMGGRGGGLPPGMMQPPDTGILRDTADAMADAVNKVFAGTGVQIAAALAFEATKIRETLENPRLPALIGAANRDQMLRQLKVAVSATYPRLETNLTQFVLSVMQLKDQPAGNEEVQYLGALFMLGSQIPWDQLSGDNSGGRITGIGGSRRGGTNL